jgi:hypothetical protein
MSAGDGIAKPRKAKRPLAFGLKRGSYNSRELGGGRLMLSEATGGLGGGVHSSTTLETKDFGGAGFLGGSARLTAGAHGQKPGGT